MIELNKVTKKYGKVLALDEITMCIEENELFGVVGPNGSGKTSLMRIISGIMAVSGGECKINGMAIRKKPEKIKKIIGYVPDYYGVYKNITVCEYIGLFASSYGIMGNERQEKCSEILTMLKLDKYRNYFVDDLSRANKQKVCIARSLIHDPKILILDEPFTGLEAKAKVEFGEILRQLNSLGTTIVISTPFLQEITELCTGIAVLEGGRVVVNGSMRAIEEKIHSINPIIMKVKYGQEYAVNILKKESRVKNLIISEDNVFFINFYGSPEQEAELLKKVVFSGAAVSSFSRKGHDIESVFLKIME